MLEFAIPGTGVYISVLFKIYSYCAPLTEAKLVAETMRAEFLDGFYLVGVVGSM